MFLFSPVVFVQLSRVLLLLDSITADYFGTSLLFYCTFSAESSHTPLHFTLLLFVFTLLHAKRQAHIHGLNNNVICLLFILASVSVNFVMYLVPASFSSSTLLFRYLASLSSCIVVFVAIVHFSLIMPITSSSSAAKVDIACRAQYTHCIRWCRYCISRNLIRASSTLLLLLLNRFTCMLYLYSSAMRIHVTLNCNICS